MSGDLSEWCWFTLSKIIETCVRFPSVTWALPERCIYVAVTLPERCVDVAVMLPTCSGDRVVEHGGLGLDPFRLGHVLVVVPPSVHHQPVLQEGPAVLGQHEQSVGAG